MELIRIGTIVNTQGLKGDVRIYPDTDYAERFEEIDYVYVEGLEEKFYIEKVRYKKNLAIIKFEGYDHINDVEIYKNKIVYTEKLELEEGHFYVEDILGLKVIDHKVGEIGVLKDVISNKAQDLYLIKRPAGDDVLIPVVPEFIKEIDLEAGIIHVTLIKGLL